MGKVEAFVVAGLELWFNSSDHLPPHFHARKPGAWEARIYFLACVERHLEVEMKWPKTGITPSRRERDALLRGALGHRVVLLREWERKVVVGKEI